MLIFAIAKSLTPTEGIVWIDQAKKGICVIKMNIIYICWLENSTSMFIKKRRKVHSISTIRSL